MMKSLASVLSNRLASGSDAARILTVAPSLVEPEGEILERASIGGCCGPCGGNCFPEMIVSRDGRMAVPRDWAPTREQMADRAWVDAALLHGCIQDIYSPITTIPAAQTAPVQVEPSQRACFVGLRERIVVRLDTDLTLTVASFGRAFAGDCPQDYQDQAAFTDFKHSDDCNWCPIPEVDIGRVDDNAEYRRDITNLLAGTAIRAQIGLRGIPYPAPGCWRGWRVRGEGGCSCGT